MKTWPGARFAHDHTLACKVCEGPTTLGLRATGAAIPPPLKNTEHGGDTWYHGTSFDPHSSHDWDEDEHDDPGGRVVGPERVGSEYGENSGHHWNTDLGVHFTSLPHVARAFATNEASVGSYERRAHPDSRVLHAGLHMANPAHFEDEHEMAKAAISWAHDNGHHFIQGGHRAHTMFRDGHFDHMECDHGSDQASVDNCDAEGGAESKYSYLSHDDAADNVSRRHHIGLISREGVQDHHGEDDTSNYLRIHPDREEITSGWREHLKSQGHDGITYGNDHEGPRGHKCAIAFDDTPIHHRRWQWLHESKQHLNSPEHGIEQGQKREHHPDQGELPGLGAFDLRHHFSSLVDAGSFFKQAASLPGLTDDSRISVAEQILETGGHSGKSWHIPRMHVDDPKRAEAHKPVHDFVHSVLADEGHSHPTGIRVQPHHWDLREPGSGQAITDGLNYIGLKGEQTNDLTLLHECAHILHGSGEGREGHGPNFRNTVSRLYRKHLGDEAADLFDRYSVPPKTAGRSEDIDALGRSEHPNVEHYRSGGIGHRDGDETKSVVGFLPTHLVRSYREHAGAWHGEQSKENVASIKADLDAGKGLTNPIQFEYDHKEKWGYVGEGNHRLEAAHQAGLKTVPVRVYGRGYTAGKKAQGIGGPMHLIGDLSAQGAPEGYVPPDVHPHHFEYPGGSTHDYDYDDGRWHLGKQGAVLDTWAPTERLFAPTKGGVDPRLFDPETRVMKPSVRAAVAVWVNEFFERNGYQIGGNWYRTYLAGSQASEWYGNNDFDILVGIEYDRFRRMHMNKAHLSNEEIGAAINADFREDFNDEQWHPPFDPENEWHLTGYVNKDSWDIAKIKPYAAYNVTDNVWAVDPIHEPTGHHFEVSEMYYFEGIAAQVRYALALKEPMRRIRCTQLWTFVHTDRSRAFGPHGSGAFDRGNALEKYLDQAPSVYDGKSLMAALAEAKFGLQAEALGQEFERAYQRPFSPMGQIGADKRLPVGHIFKHPEIERHPAEYSLTMNHYPEVARVRTDALRPTQPHVDEEYLHKGDNPTRMPHDLPGVIKDMRGRYRLVDGHHRAARALLNGESHIDVQLWDERKAFPWKTKEKKTAAESGAPTKAYYPPEGGGKLHRSNPITGQAWCRGSLLLDTTAMPFHVSDDAERVHPMVCRKCLGKDHPANRKQASRDPSGLEFRHEPWGDTSHRISAHDGEREVGHLFWQDGFGDYVGTVHVDESHRRRGIATEMLRRAREINPALRHSQWQSDDGKAWSEKVGGRVAHRGHDVYGSNSIDRLFPEGAPITSTPWPLAPRTKSKPIPYSKDLLGKALMDPGQHMDEVDPRHLHAYQPSITRAGVNYYLGDHYKNTGETYADGHHAANQVPVVYTRSDGKSIILSGHHRAAAALLKGEKLQCLHVREEAHDGAEDAVRHADPVPRRASASVSDGEGAHGAGGAGGHRERWYSRLAARLLDGGRDGADVAGRDRAPGGEATAVREDRLAVEAWYKSDHPDVEEGSDQAEFQPDTEAVKDEMDRLRGGPRVKASELREHMANGTVPKHLYRAISESDFHRAKAQGYLDTHGEKNWMGPNKGEHAEGMVTATDPHHIGRTYLPDEGGRVIKIETHPEHGWRPHFHDRRPQWQTSHYTTKVPWEHVVDHSAPIERRFNPDTWSTQDAIQMRGEGHAPADHTSPENYDYFTRVVHPAFHHLHPSHPEHGKTAAVSRTAGMFGPSWYETAHDDEIDAHQHGQQIRDDYLTHHTSPQGHVYRLTHDSARYVTATYLGKGENRIQKPQMVGRLSWFGGKAKPVSESNIEGRIHKVFVKPAHRRRGLASAMLDHARAKSPNDDILHSSALSEDGAAWAEKKASKTSPSWEFFDHEGSGAISAMHGDDEVGMMDWQRHPEGHAVINSLWVHPEHRRKGLATQMYREVTKRGIDLHHNDQRTADGDAWARSLGHDVQPGERVSWDNSLYEAARRFAAKAQSIEVAGVVIKAEDTGRVLLLQRSFDDEEDPARGTWEFPGGHIDEGESPFEAAKREWGEETGGTFPEDAPVVGNWISNGMYQGFIVVIPKEGDLDINLDHEDRQVLNPDDPDGDGIEVVAWWEVKHLDGNPAVRKEVQKGTDWSMLKKAKLPDSKVTPEQQEAKVALLHRVVAMSNPLPKHWVDHIESFQAKHDADAAKGSLNYRDPEDATGQCLDAAGDFAHHVRERSGGQHQATEEFFEHLREVPPRRPQGVPDGKTVEHLVNVTHDSGHVIDWTASQFHPGADFPHVEPVETYRQKWHHTDVNPERCEGCKATFDHPGEDALDTDGEHEGHQPHLATRGLGWHHVVKSQRNTMYPVHHEIGSYIRQKTGVSPEDLVWTAEPFAVADAEPDPHGIRSRTRLDSAEQGYRLHRSKMPPVIAIEHDGKREHVDGWHRLGGAERVGLTHVPAYVGRVRT